MPFDIYIWKRRFYGEENNDCKNPTFILKEPPVLVELFREETLRFPVL